ncbi:MAG TPA: heme ABC exporter ATP-binding protein CcmA [Chloroflexi bacterium]|nr:heme ABC exporter ATP-binding protein CcmA [Chloroflexota bacterium]
MPVIEVKKLVKRFGLKTILKGLEFYAEPGEFIGLLGPNGAGKTTFLRILASLSRPTLGVVKVAGYHLPQQAAGVRANLGVLSHQPLLYGDLTAEENLRFYARMYGLAQPAQRIAQVLEQVNLSHRAGDLVRTFSRGMQQRLAIARAFVLRPKVLLLDEPTTNLDPAAVRGVEELIGAIGAAGTKILMTTHDIAQAKRLAADVMFLNDGRLLEHAPAAEFFAAPKDPAASRFLAGELLD